MSFSFSTEFDSQTYVSMQSLIKTNEGCFKSLKQSNFLFNQYKKERSYDTVESVKKFFGIELNLDECVVEVNAHVRWADYGRKSFRPVTWMYVIDKYGVVAQYKLGYVGDTNSGTCPDPKKTTKLWERTCKVSEFEEPIELEQKPSSFVSHVGRRIEMTCKIKKIRTFEKQRFHYYDSSIGYMTIMDFDGNVVIYWGKFEEANEGDIITIRATIKDHNEKDGVKQTFVNRPKLITKTEKTV